MKFESEEQELEYYKKYFEEGSKLITWINRDKGIFIWSYYLILKVTPKSMAVIIKRLNEKWNSVKDDNITYVFLNGNLIYTVTELTAIISHPYDIPFNTCPDWVKDLIKDKKHIFNPTVINSNYISK